MRIINITARRAKSSYKCECCGEQIKVREQYNYLKFRSENTIRHLKAHIKCLSLARNLGLLEREQINMYNFTKSARDYIYRLQEGTRQRISRKAVERYPISELVRRLDMFYADLEREKAQRMPRSFDSMRVEVALLTETLMMPSVIDSLIESLYDANLYRGNVKQILAHCLKEFENMSKKLGDTFKSTEELDKMCTSCMSVFNKIDSSVLVSGVDKWSSILMACISDMMSKYRTLQKEVNVKSQIEDLINLEKKLRKVLQYEHFDFVNIIVTKECSEKGIHFIEEDNVA